MSIVVPNTLLIVKALFIALILSIPAGWLGARLAIRIKLIDYPGSAAHKTHSRPVPQAGGIIILIVLLAASALQGTLDNPIVKSTILAGTIIFIFGVWDDYVDLSPLAKFYGQTLAAIGLILLGVHVQIFESPEFFLHTNTATDIYLDWLITIVWVIGITNAYNFIDSMDGLAVGIAATSSAFFVLTTLDAGQLALAQHSAILIGMCVGIYLLNSSPAIIFLGDSGSQLLGFIMAVLAIGYTPEGANQSSSWMVPILLLGIPVFDATLVVISRLRRNAGIFQAARDHTYHRLQRVGFDPGRAVLIMQVTAFALCCLALIILYQPPVIANLIFMLVLIAAGWAILYLEKTYQASENRDLE